MNGLVGADIERLRALASSFRGGADVLHEISVTAPVGIERSAWRGADADVFAARWHEFAGPAIQASAHALDEAARDLVANAEAQAQASTADQVATAAPGALEPDTAREFRDHLDGMSPAEIASAWSSLDPGTRAWLQRHRPHLIGNLDGIPFGIRALCNESEVVRLWSAFEPSRAAVLADHPDWMPESIDILAGQQVGLTPEQVAALTHVHSEFPASAGGSRDQAHHLVAFDLSGGDLPRAAVSFGDLDTATNVVVYVPGMGSRVGKDTFHSHIDNAEALYNATGAVLRRAGDAASSSAAVYWLGYDAPQGLSVVSNASSAEGSELLARFMDGAQSVNPDSRMTVGGHSYGSIVATGASEGTDSIDSLVVFGSPGVGLWPHPQTPASECYYGQAGDDPLTDLPVKGRLPRALGWTELPTEALDGYKKSSGHSEYLWDGTTFQQALAAIAAGHPEMVPGRG